MLPHCKIMFANIMHSIISNILFAIILTALVWTYLLLYYRKGFEMLLDIWHAVRRSQTVITLISWAHHKWYRTQNFLNWINSWGLLFTVTVAAEMHDVLEVAVTENVAMLDHLNAMLYGDWVEINYGILLGTQFASHWGKTACQHMLLVFINA